MRHRFKSGTEYPPMIALGDTAEMRNAKKVRFVSTETDGIPVHASLRGHEATQSPRSGAPKTSEYAYFRKVKKGAAHGISRSLHKENERLKSSRINCLIRETITAPEVPKSSIEDFRFSVSGERERPSDPHLFHSPRVSKYDEPGQMRSKELANTIKKKSSSLSKNLTPIEKSPSSSPLEEALQNSDDQCIEEGIFSAKRHGLRQWAAHTSFSEAGKPHPKGFDFDLVSSLPSGLFPKGNENNDSSKEDTDNSSKSLKSDNLDKGLDLSHKREWDKNLSKICSGRSSEIGLSEWDTFVSGFSFPNYATESHPQDKAIDLGPRSKNHICRTSPTQHDFSFCLPFHLTFVPGFPFPDYAAESHPQDEPIDLGLRSKSHICGSSSSQHDYSFCLPFERYRSSGSFHFKRPDEVGSVIEHAGEAPNRLSLEWDFGGGKDRRDSSFIDQDTADNENPRLGTSWNVDQQGIVDNMVDSRGLYSSSLSSNYHLEFDLLPYYCSTSYLTQEFGPKVDDLKCAMAESIQFPLALPYASAEDRNTGNIHHDSNIIFSYGDQHWLRNKVWDDKPQSDFWWKFSSATDDPLSNYHAWQFPTKSLRSFSEEEEDPGEPFTPFSKGTFNNHFFSSNFQSSPDTFGKPPLLLDHVNHNRSKKEYFDNDDDNDLLYE